jgi:large subunit ribosomal protein L6
MSETETRIQVPNDVDASVDHLEVTISGPEGSVTRRLWYPDITVTTAEDAVVITTGAQDAKTNATAGTFESHVRNMIFGVTEGWEYRMEVFYSHFPMQVTAEGSEVVIENFLGERHPRRVDVRGDTEVQVDGEDVTLLGPSIEDVGQTAASIEQMTRVNDKDTRVFQDGVYITEKPTRGEA